MKAIYLLLFVCGYTLFGICATYDEESAECYNKFQYENKVLEQLLELRNDIEQEKATKAQLIADVKAAESVIEDLKTQISSMKTGLEGSAYTRWGRTVCPEEANLVYKGFVAKGHRSHSGSGSNYQCLPNDPLWDQYTDGFQTADRIYGTEYYSSGYSNWKYLHGHDVPCAVCRIPRNDVLMIPGRNQCYDNYKLEYSGYLMAEYYTHTSSDYVCVDRQPETLAGGHIYRAESTLFFVQANCGVIKCPPYVSGRELTCAVCSYSP